MFNLDQKVNLVNILHYFPEWINRIGNIDFFEKGVNSQEKFHEKLILNLSLVYSFYLVHSFFIFIPCGKIVPFCIKF